MSSPPRVAISRARLWLGRDELPARPRRVRAGPLTFDLDGIDVRGVAYEGHELLSRIYVAVRDLDWNTLPPTISHLEVARPGADTLVTFQARHEGADIAYRWHGRIRATGDGHVDYEMDGHAGDAFDYSKIGFCVLHPASLAGRPYRAMTPDGQRAGRLPELIEPQRIVDGHEMPLIGACSALSVDLPWGTVTTRFEGDLFETEDQRNWTDGSYKTYSTPLALGHPLRARRRQSFHPVVRLTFAPQAGAAPASTDRPRHTWRSGRRIWSGLEPVGPEGVGWPALGLGAATGSASRPLGPRESGLLRALAMDHLRLDLRLSDGMWPERLARSLEEARSLACRLEVALFASEATAAQLPRAAALLTDSRVARVIGLYEPTAGTATTPPAWVDRIVKAFPAARPPRPPILTGTDGDFAELNRDRPALGAAAGVAYAANSQVHAWDERSLVEALPTYGLTVATARSFAGAGATAVAVTPITLRGRFNPAARADSSEGMAAPPADPRQRSLFAAGWTLGVAAALTFAGADSVTLYETIGRRGVIGPLVDAASGRAGPGMVYPLWFVLADLEDRSRHVPVRLGPELDPAVAGLAMYRPGHLRVLVANVTARAIRLAIGRISGRSARVRVLDARSTVAAVSAPQRFRASGQPHEVSAQRLLLELGPFAYARVDAKPADAAWLPVHQIPSRQGPVRRPET